MQFADTVSGLTRVENRPSLNQVNAYYQRQSNSIQEAVVLKVGPLENFECSLIVYVYNTNERYKVEATLGEGASASTSTGRFRPYFPGDKVLVSFLYGDAARICIVGRVYDQSGLSEYMLQPGNPIPLPGEETPSGTKMRPSPLAVYPEAVAQKGFAALESFPLLLI